MNRFIRVAWTWGVALGVAACGVEGQEALEVEEAPVSRPLHSERGGIGLSMELPASEGVSAQAQVVDIRRSLAVTDKSILAQFTLPGVFDQLKAQNGASGYSANQLFRQLWDTQNAATSAQADLPGEAHCTDNGNTLNGFTYDCRGAEGSQANTAALANINSYKAVGLFNRFDLAASDGADCGEYRIVFAKNSTTSGRNFIIWEAVLPNPNPNRGIEGCRPVATFWADLTADADPASRATKLRDFYFTGLPGFPPVVHLNNYGNNARDAGQVRTNQFMSGPWMLREFKLERACPSTGCTLRFVPATVKTNPFGDLFNPNRTDALAQDFQSAFVNQVPNLAVNDLNKFFYVVEDRFNSGQSADRSTPDGYLSRFSQAGSTTFRTNIQNKLTSLGSSLTPEQVVVRAQTQSCIGCHQHTNNASLGGGLTWPSSASFVHSTESDDPADPSRFRLSNALVNNFLPQRKAVLETFLDTPVKDAQFVSQVVPTQIFVGGSVTVKVTMKNTGTHAWREGNAFRLGSQSPQDNMTWGRNRVVLSSTETIHQGQQKTFSFTITAPTTAGTYAFQWRMMHDSVAPFGASSPVVSIRVVSSIGGGGSCGCTSAEVDSGPGVEQQIVCPQVRQCPQEE